MGASAQQPQNGCPGGRSPKGTPGVAASGGRGARIAPLLLLLQWPLLFQQKGQPARNVRRAGRAASFIAFPTRHPKKQKAKAP